MENNNTPRNLNANLFNAIVEFLTGLCELAKKVLTDHATDTFGADDPRTQTIKNFGPSFFGFMVEYALAAIKQDIEDGVLPANTMRSRNIFCDAVVKNLVEFARAFTTNISATIAITEAFSKRVAMEEEMPFFSPVMPMLTDMWEHASEVEA